MKLSLATRIFLGYAVVLVTFGAVSLFSVAEMHRNQQEIRLISQGYLRLSQDAASLETFYTNQDKDTERLLDEQNPETRRTLIPLARLYIPAMSQRLASTRDTARNVLTYAPASELSVIQEMESDLGKLEAQYATYERTVNAVFTLLTSDTPDPKQVAAFTKELRQVATTIGRDLRALRARLDNRIRERVDRAEERERRTGLAIITLSLLAVGVGLGATLLSAR
jgi:two-component system NtrC family sensor kinase